MKILALETSTLLGSACLFENDKVLEIESSLRQKSHSEVMNRYVDNILQKHGLELKDLDLFSVGQGPGSFTGIRIAGNIAKTYSFVTKKPIVTLDSLSLLALNLPAQSLPVLAIINAYKNMVYYGLFEPSFSFKQPPTFIAGPSVTPVKYLEDVLKGKKCVVVGDGFDAYKDFFPESLSKLLVRPQEKVDHPRADILAQIAPTLLRSQTLDWKSFVPLYIRASEAEENQRGILRISIS